MISNRFKVNQYNWLGQKLLAQHRYDELLEVRRHLSGRDPALQLSQTDQGIDSGLGRALDGEQKVISDHMNYITGLALMKTRGIPFEKLINILQRLNYQKNGQYFLLLCQCLLYLGHHDSVVAICKQVLNREIEMTSVSAEQAASVDEAASEVEEKTAETLVTNDHKMQRREQHGWCLEAVREESLEFKNMIDCVDKNCLINDSRLWYIFALSLELQSLFRDADLAYRVASKLASGQSKHMTSAVKSKSDQEHGSSEVEPNTISMSDYCEPHIRYAEFCIRHREDYKTAIQVLNQASGAHSSPVNHNLSSSLALALCSQPNSNTNLFSKASEIIQMIDNHSASTRNPSFVYNQIALKCKQKLYSINSSMSDPLHENYASNRTGDERRLNLGYALTKSFVIINDIVQEPANGSVLFKSPTMTESLGSKSTIEATSKLVQTQVDKAIETLRSCDSSCWLSHSLWNNLGVCYLMKRRYVASLSCFTKAIQLNPLDWRINYNIGLAYLHVNVAVRALCCSLAARSFHHEAMKVAKYRPASLNLAPSGPLINTALASCYTCLSLKAEARRYYAEMIALCGRKGGVNRALVAAIINYLLLLHRTSLDTGSASLRTVDEQDNKLIIRLLDQLEQDWLQRNPTDTQYVSSLLDVARIIGECQHSTKPQMKKSYAWTKYN